ncbi:MAG: hypothetical protein WCG36_00555 [bacterium]
MERGLLETGNGSVEILHRTGESGQHMGLDLWDGDNGIRLKHRVGNREEDPVLIETL